MSTLELLIKMREILYARYKQHYPILDLNTFMQAMDEVHYKNADGKLYITMVLDLPPIIENVPINDDKDYSNARG